MSATVIPVLRYRNAPAAIEFLQNVLGFEATLVVDGKDGLIEHAQLTHGTGMVMLASVTESAYQRAASGNEDPPGIGATYVVVEDVYAHAAKARSFGADIILEPAEQDYGGASYTVKDPEGNVWSFGSYNPWDSASIT